MKDDMSGASRQGRISRRGFVGTAAATFCPGGGGAAAGSAAERPTVRPELSAAVQMQFLYPDLVDLSALGDGPLAPDMKPPDGIGGQDPRKYASAEVGRRNIELAAQAIGRKAKELLESLPPDQRSFNLRAIRYRQARCMTARRTQTGLDTGAAVAISAISCENPVAMPFSPMFNCVHS